MYKSLFLILLSCILFISFPARTLCSAAESLDNGTHIITETHYLDDGSYLVISTTIGIPTEVTRDMYTISSSRTYNYHNSDGSDAWDVTLYGTFLYNGINSSCIASSASYNIYSSYWSKTDLLTKRMGNTAIAEFTFEKSILGIITNTVSDSITLSCSPAGVIY